MVEVSVVVVPFLIAMVATVVPTGVMVVVDLPTSNAKSASNLDILLMYVYVIFELT